MCIRDRNKDAMEPGDALIALPSSGVHSNGFSLVRKVLELEKGGLSRRYDELSATLGEALLTPTKIYVKPVLSALAAGIRVHAISHITGGGFYENIPRALKPGCVARIAKAAVQTRPVFRLIQEAGRIPQRDMFNTFNMGVGMCLVVHRDDASQALNLLRESGEGAYLLGEVARGEGGVELW